MLDLIHNQEFQKLKEQSDSYRQKVIIAGRIANVSKRVTKTPEQFDEAKTALKAIKRAIAGLPKSRHRYNLWQLSQCAMWRIIGIRLLHHEEKSNIYFLISALGRKKERKPQPERGRVCVTVEPARTKSKAWFGIF